MGHKPQHHTFLVVTSVFVERVRVFRMNTGKSLRDKRPSSILQENIGRLLSIISS